MSLISGTVGLCGLMAVSFAHAQRMQAPDAESAAKKKDIERKKLGLEIHVAPGNWGDASPEDIEAVLYSVAAVMLERFPNRSLAPIVVSHTPIHPITLYEKGRHNEYQVYLSAKDMRWAQYVYEFAHEFAHILTNYDHQPYSSMMTPNQWFAESLCEVASLYALKRLAHVWTVSPPYPQWAAYAPVLERYANFMINEAHRRLPPDATFAGWFKQNEQSLRGDPYLRAHNEVVANKLLPLFEEDPLMWEAAAYLNLKSGNGTFQEYLEGWHSAAPDTCKKSVKNLITLFGFNGDAASSSADYTAAGQATAPQPDTVPAQ